MSMMTKIFGQNAKGENGLKVLKDNMLISIFNIESQSDPNMPEMSLKDLAIMTAIMAPITGLAGFAATYLVAMSLSETPLTPALTYGLPIGAAIFPTACILESGYAAIRDTYKEVSWNHSSRPLEPKP